MLYGVLFGYEMKNGKVRLQKENARAVKMIFKECIDGKSLTEIARELKKKNISKIRGSTNWHSTEIKNLIREKRYLGDAEYPKMVSHEIFEKAQEILNTRIVAEESKEFYKARRESEVFYDKIYCSVCGKKFNKEYQHNTWKCSGNWKKGAVKHPKKSYREKILEKIVVDGINALLEVREVGRKQVGGAYFRETKEVKDATKTLEESLQNGALSVEERKKLIFEKAQVMVKHCVVRDVGLEQDLMGNYLKGRQRMEHFDEGIFKGIVDKILISPNEEVAVKFIDGTIIDILL